MNYPTELKDYIQAKPYSDLSISELTEQANELARSTEQEVSTCLKSIMAMVRLEILWDTNPSSFLTPPQKGKHSF